MCLSTARQFVCFQIRSEVNYTSTQLENTLRFSDSKWPRDGRTRKIDHILIFVSIVQGYHHVVSRVTTTKLRVSHLEQDGLVGDVLEWLHSKLVAEFELCRGQERCARKHGFLGLNRLLTDGPRSRFGAVAQDVPVSGRSVLHPDRQPTWMIHISLSFTEEGDWFD